MINARAETVVDRPSFRTAAVKRRAIVSAFLESLLSR
jgi:putative SOS response-associated peptidase YedK